MATNYWQGTTGDWQTAANWSGASVPVDGDVVIFDGRVSQSVTEGTEADESGAAGSGGLDVLHVKSSFAGSIGTAAEPLTIHADKIIIEGSGTFHIAVGKDDQDTDAYIPLVIVNNSAATVNLYSYANSATKLAMFTDVVPIAGTVNLCRMLAAIVEDPAFTVDTGCYAENLYVLPTGNNLTGVTVTISTGCLKVNGDVPMNLYMKTGRVTTDSPLGRVFQAGGALVFGTDLGASPVTGLNIAELVDFGGSATWRPDDSSGDAHIGKAIIAGATLDASGSVNADRAKALGDGNGYPIIIGTGGALNIANGRSNIALAAGSVLANLGGTVITDIARQVVVGGVSLGLATEHA